MKSLYSFVLIVCSTIFLNAQEVTTIAATIVDAETQKPVAFVNIGFLDKNIGTVSDIDGQFSLTWNDKKTKGVDFLQISSLGYETKQIATSKLETLTSYKAKILLSPVTYNLDEVVLISEKQGFEKLGSAVYNIDKPAYWRNSKALGGEIATKIEIDHPNTLLHNVKFNVRENFSDSLLVRVNIYDYHRGKPGKKVLSQNIFHTIKRKKGEETILLKQYGIRVDEDIVFSIELVEVYGDAIYFEIATSPYKGVSFTREVSQDRWREYGNTAIAFHLMSSYPEGGGKRQEITRKRPKNIDLYWDASLRMASRDISEEMKLLSKYMNHLQNVTVRTIVFGKGRFSEKTFDVKNGRSKALESYLKSSFYNGAPDFSKVLQQNPHNADAALVFSAGVSSISYLQPAIDIPIFCVNSKQKANHKLLQEVSYLSGGHYLNLSSTEVASALFLLQKEKKDTDTYSNNLKDKSGFVHGVVYNENGNPIQGATVSVKNTFDEVETGPNGNYAIDALQGEKLIIKAFGMYQKDTVVGPLKKMHIPLKTNRELLDEVHLETKTTSEKIATEIVDTPFGYKKRGSIGFSLYNRFTSEDIRTEDASVGSILKRMPGVFIAPTYLEAQETIYVFTKTSKLSFLNGGATFPVIILDDMLYDQNAGQTLPPIDPQTIDNILLLKTAQSTVKYGQLAAYGAIVIETKQYKQAKELQSGQSDVPVAASALISGNDYVESTSVALLEKKTRPVVYIKSLEKSSSLEAAKEQYFELQKQYGNTIPFYLESARYFEALDVSFAESVRSNILALAPSNSKALRALAFEYEAIGKTEDAKKLYEHILYLKLKDVQSYLDLARLSAETGDIETAETLYTQLLYNTIPNINATELQEQISNGFKHLAVNHKSKLNYKELPKELFEVGYKEDIRIVFDWSDAATDFELQFVNPENKYFTFSHTVFENKSFIEKEIKDGFASKQFIIDSSLPGRWLINIEHLGEEEIENPTYLKYTLFRNYGLPSETKEIKVINLSEYTKKITLDKIVL